MYRKFSMLNGDETLLDLSTPASGIFLNRPQGLGFTNTTNFTRIGNDNLLNYQQYEFPQISFDIVFCDGTNAQKYAKYTSFIRFLSSGNLYLIYEIPSTNIAYRIPFEVSSLTKSEVGTNNLLECSMTISPTSFWEDNIKKTLYIDGSDGDNGKRYPLNRPFAYQQNSFTDISINSVSLLATPFEFTIEGNVTNPYYKLFDEQGKEYGSGKFIGTFDKVYVNSDPLNEEIVLELNDEEIANPYSYQDFEDTTEETTFLTLKSGKNKIAFYLGNSFQGNVTIEWRDRYVSV